MGEAVHEHQWQAQGLVREQRESCSPCSVWDDVLSIAVISVQTCACGKVKRTHVANENVRRRGDDLRRGQR